MLDPERSVGLFQKDKSTRLFTFGGLFGGLAGSST